MILELNFTLLKKLVSVYAYLELRSQKRKFKRIGDNVILNKGSIFNHPEKIELADHIYIGPEARIWAQGGLSISENVIIGPGITIVTANHRYKGATMLPYDGHTWMKPVTIEKNIWIGANVKLCPGVTIQEGSVIGMGAVVTKDVPKYSIMGGNPAQIIKKRCVEEYNHLDQKKSYYLKMKKEKRVEFKEV